MGGSAAGLVIRLMLWVAAEVAVGVWCADAEFSVAEAALLAGRLACVNWSAGGVRAVRAAGKADEECNHRWEDQVWFHDVGRVEVLG